MALSAVIRTGQQVGLTMLTDILRGSARAEIIERGYDRIKTYGVGRRLPFSEWNSYIGQMIQLGLLDMAYNDHNRLKVTPYGMSVLKGATTVMLSRYHPAKPAAKTSKKSPAATPSRNPAELLFAELKRLRMSLAKAEGIAPYLVFTDKTLMEMVKKRPVTLREFNNIEGVGECKSLKYWSRFTELIKRFKWHGTSVRHITAHTPS